MIFAMLEIGDIFGINTDLRIDPNSIPYPESSELFLGGNCVLVTSGADC